MGLASARHRYSINSPLAPRCPGAAASFHEALNVHVQAHSSIQPFILHHPHSEARQAAAQHILAVVTFPSSSPTFVYVHFLSSDFLKPRDSRPELPPPPSSFCPHITMGFLSSSTSNSSSGSSSGISSAEYFAAEHRASMAGAQAGRATPLPLSEAPRPNHDLTYKSKAHVQKSSPLGELCIIGAWRSDSPAADALSEQSSQAPCWSIFRLGDVVTQCTVEGYSCGHLSSSTGGKARAPSCLQCPISAAH